MFDRLDVMALNAPKGAQGLTAKIEALAKEHAAALAAIEGIRSKKVAYEAAVQAENEDYRLALKALQKEPWEKVRDQLKAIVCRGKNMSEFPGLQVSLRNFGENGEDADPTLSVSIAKTMPDGSTKTTWLYGGPTVRRSRRSKGGKSYRGQVITLVDIKRGDGTIRVPKGTGFDSTRFLAEACGHSKGKFGYYNELRAHGQKRGVVWEYTAYIADQAKNGAEG